MEKRKKGRGGTGGSKLNRSETVTMRLDPKLRYLTELAARRHRRTVSSFIEWAIESQLEHVILCEDYDYRDGSTAEVSLAHEALKLWDIDESDRIAKLALYYPELLTHEEQVIWKLVRECGYLWRGQYDQQGYWTWEIKLESLDFFRLRTHWETFKQVAAGEADKDSLPHWEARESKASKSNDEMPVPSDDDIPF